MCELKACHFTVTCLVVELNLIRLQWQFRGFLRFPESETLNSWDSVSVYGVRKLSQFLDPSLVHNQKETKCLRPTPQILKTFPKLYNTCLNLFMHVCIQNKIRNHDAFKSHLCKILILLRQTNYCILICIVGYYITSLSYFHYHLKLLHLQ